jgi:uncharacterized protein involved in exopolysaccharide biosynthesis
VEQQEEVIDLSVLSKIVWQYKKKLLGLIVATTLVAVAVAFMLPKQYESTTLIRAKAVKPNGFSLQAAAAVSLLGGNMQSPVLAYIELMKSRSVLDPVIAQLELPQKQKENMNNVSFAKSYLKIENTKGTDLITVGGMGRSPEEAQMISSSVVDNFKQLLTRMNQSDQSLLMKFLQERIQVAKKEMNTAEQKLEKFRQQKKVFLPDDQARAAVKKITDIDQQLAQMEVQNQTNQAKLDGIDQQLAAQKLAVSKYQLADNPEIQQIRSNITNKQMALVELRQKYTEKHPSVILAEKEIAELKAKLKELVGQEVAAGTTTLNPVQSGLLQSKVETEAALLGGQAAVEGMRRIQSKNEKEISTLSTDSVTYIDLQRRVNISQEVYATLVKNYEQARIQEAMESMDIEVVDPANLPKFPAAPNKRLITALGIVVGLVLDFVYVLIVYNRKPLSSKEIKDNH